MSPLIIWQNSGSSVTAQNALDQSNWGIFLKYNILWKKWVMKLIYCIQININIFYKLILPFLVGVVMHVQITNQIAEFFEMQYHKKGLIDCFKFLDVEIPSSSIFKNFPVFGECAWTCPKYPTYQICNFLGIVCPIVWIFLDAYRALRELCIYTTVLNEFVQVYAQSTWTK